VNWDWLYGHIMAVITPAGVVLGLAGYSARDLLRKKRAARAEAPAVEPPKPAQTPISAAQPVAPAPRWVMRPGYSSHGHVASTGAVVDDMSGYLESMISQPRPNGLSLKSGRWTAGTTASAAGTASTA
jgi:hypothetical protein